MNTLWNKLLCVILSLALLISLLPVSAMALDTPVEQQSTPQHRVEDPLVETTEKTTQPMEILSEDISKRGEFYKEFILNNGLRMASLYAEPVHYSEAGQWKEIDNTLKLADGAYTNTAGQWQVSFPQQLTKDKAVTITKDGYTLSFFMAGALYQDTTSLVRSTLGSAVQEQPVQLQSLQAATAQVQTLERPELQEETEYPQAIVEKNRSRLQYTNVSADTNIVYDLKGNQVKESIVMDSYNAQLRGYRYTLDVGELNPVLTDSGEIHLYDRDRKEVVMVMPAPFLVDDAGEISYDVAVTLDGSGSTYTLNYRLPQQWLSSAERQWPVVLDPVVNAQIGKGSIEDVSVYQRNTPENYTSGILDVGNNKEYGIMRTFLKYNNLPSLSSADVIVTAMLRLYKPNQHSTTNPVEIHKVASAWTASTMTWENQPEFSSLVEDFDIVKDNGYYYWEITNLVRSWYESGNRGLMLKAPGWVEENNSETSYRKQFYSSDYNATNPATNPILTIIFRNNNGLESYWDYTTLSAGRAGTGYINSYTGNLVWTHSDIGYGGNRMPVSISHIYNANDCANDLFGMGKGWQINYNQTVSRYTKNETAVTYYVWNDSDGTDHYFYQDEGSTYKDEDGLELTLTRTGSGSSDLTCTIEDKNGNTSYFDSKGRLYKLENNQQTKSNISITYTTDTGFLISRITDGVGRKYNFTYTDGKLTRISYAGTGSNEEGYVRFYYVDGFLTRIIDQDEKVCYYTYTNTNQRLLYTAQDIDGYKLTFHYTVGNPSRISKVDETSNSVSNTVLTITYQHNQTTFQDVKGNVQIMQFNNWGNTTAVQDQEGHAQYATYASSDASDGQKGNQLILSSKLQNTVGNMLNNSSFEGTSLWTAVEGSTCSTVSAAYLGNQAMQFTKASGTAFGGVRSAGFTAAAGKTYTFSAYLKTASNSTAYLSLGPNTSVVSLTLPTGQNWTRVEVSYTNHTASDVTIYAQVLTQSVGTVYVDCVQLEMAETASRYNIVQNGDFRYGEDSWIRSEYCTDHGVVTGGSTGSPTLEKTVFKMVGIPEHLQRIRQRFSISGQKGDTFVLAGWAKGDAVPLTDDDRRFSIRGTFYYTDGTEKEFVFHFNPDSIQWQYTSGVMVAEKAYSEIKVEFMYDYNANDVYFDGMQLYKEEYGNSYTYDDDGNVISVKDLQGQTTQYEYSSNGTDLLKVIQNNQAKVTYTYDDYHNVKTATTQEGLVYSFVYDAYGNNTSVSIENGSSKITSKAAYTADGNYPVSATAATGDTTTYGYNTTTGLLEWVKYPKDTDATKTEYTYDQMYRMVQAELTTDGGQTLSADYTYNDSDQLTAITTGSTTYQFTYGNFGLRSSVKVGGVVLANYQYDAETKFLTELDYGNNNVVQYTYDNQGRITQQTYDDGDYVTFKYDNSGSLATVYDSGSGITSTYYYDFTDRLMKLVEQSGSNRHTASYGYDRLNNLTSLTETFNGIKRTTGYAYDEDNRVTSVTTAGGTETYTYDAFGRVSKIVTKENSTVVLTRTYTYQNNTNGAPTGRVSTMTVTGSGYNVTYRYTYDKNGNLLSVSDGTNSTAYVYDSANQLVRENNQAANLTKGWTYDDAGNIVSSREYAYATGTVGERLKSNSYTYGNAWGDLLTAYNGQAITYDAIGNPLSDGSWTYGWEHGRELASLDKGSAVTITQQPEDCFCAIGGSASFTTVASGTGLSCRWQYSQDGGSTWKYSTNGTAIYGTLSITGVDSYLMGLDWRCVVTDATGHTAISQTVRCRNTADPAPLKITDQPDTVYCAIGDPASFTVTASGTGLCCRWQYSPDGGITWKNSTNGTATYATLHMSEVSEYLMGMDWRCKVMDSSGNVVYSRTVYLKRNTTRWVNTYNSDGIRISRTNRESAYHYTYLGGQLTKLTVDGHTMYFNYGADGTPLSMTYNGTNYYYVTSLQGDVIAILNSSGTVVTTYLYDAWGKIISVTGTLAGTVGRYNPLRYRGYVYDTETKLYYLQSRYYNPETGRFINADGYTATGQGVLGNNMFAYCGNNPVLFEDSTGTFFSIIRGIKRMVKRAAKNTLAAINYYYNSAADSDTSSTTKNKIINDQNGVTGDSYSYGLYDASWNACEAIAVHNAKVLLNRESSLSETMLCFQLNDAMIGGGGLGSNPWDIGKVLATQGIDYSRVGLNGMTASGVYIISYWNSNPLMNGLHTVAVSYDGTTYTTYNLTGDGGPSEKNPAEYASRFICGYYLGGA